MHNHWSNHWCISATLLSLLIITCSCAPPNTTEKLGQRPLTLTKDLIDYPHFFFDENQRFTGVFLLDENASAEDLATAQALLLSLKKYDPSMNDSLIRYYPRYSNLQEKNAILIGSCSQSPKNRFVNIYTDCLSIQPDQALIRIINHQETWLLFVVGATPEMTRNAVTVLSSYKEYPLNGNDVEVVPEQGLLRVGSPR